MILRTFVGVQSFPSGARGLVRRLLRGSLPMTRHGGSAVRNERGFTLVELMITVAIMGVLAALAVLGYTRWIRTAKTAEATSVMSSIKGQQDTYRAETLKYLDCTAGGKNLGQHYPAPAPTDKKQTFDTSACGSDVVCLSFRRLNVTSDKQVYYVYSCAAGPADGTAVSSSSGRTYGVANDTWNIIRAVGDLNNNGKTSLFETSSFDSSIWSVNSDE